MVIETTLLIGSNLMVCTQKQIVLVQSNE